MPDVSNRIRRAKPLLGTFVEIEAAGPVRSVVNQAIDAAFEAVATVHRLMSFHAADSDVSRLNREAFDRPVMVHDWTFGVLEASVALHRQSNGIFDIATAPILQTLALLPRFDDDAPVDERTYDAVELLEGQMVRFRQRHVKIDLGGIAKGFAVDQALNVLRGAGRIDSGLVNAGGDLAAFGADCQLVDIRHPREPSRIVGQVKVSNEALASTARRFDLFRSGQTTGSAIIGPGRLPPTNGIDGVTVRAASCMIADALTKIAMISGADSAGLLERYRASALLINADGDVQISPDWQYAVYLAA
jgi:thiamine biosynthesis lipoprotein